MAQDAAIQKARLHEAILCHIKKYPLAADTVDGILSCWLPCAGFENAGEHIAAVLDELVAQHWLQARQLPDGNTLYVRSDACERWT
jgi:hypothetical protein